MVPADIEMLATIALVGAGLLGGVGAFLAVLSVGHRPAMIAAACASAACALGGVGVIAGPAVEMRVGGVLGYGLIDLRFDALSGLFLVALGVVGAASSVYALGYHDAGRSRLDTLGLRRLPGQPRARVRSGQRLQLPVRLGADGAQLGGPGRRPGAEPIGRPGGLPVPRHDPPRHGGDRRRVRHPGRRAPARSTSAPGAAAAGRPDGSTRDVVFLLCWSASGPRPA